MNYEITRFDFHGQLFIKNTLSKIFDSENANNVISNNNNVPYNLKIINRRNYFFLVFI